MLRAIMATCEETGWLFPALVWEPDQAFAHRSANGTKPTSARAQLTPLLTQIGAAEGLLIWNVSRTLPRCGVALEKKFELYGNKSPLARVSSS